MLSPNVTASLDHLANLGILDYDAAAHIAGSNPRYYGSPKYYVPPIVMTPMDYTTFSYNKSLNPFVSCGQPGACTRIPWKLIFGGGLALGGFYFVGKLFSAAVAGVRSFSLKDIFKNGKKTLQGAVEDAQIAARRGGKRVRRSSRKVATKLGIRKPWYKKAGNAISNGWSSFTKALKKVKIR